MFFKIIKRIVDIIGSLIGIVILLPFFPFIAFAIKLDSFFSIIPGIDHSRIRHCECRRSNLSVKCRYCNDRFINDAFIKLPRPATAGLLAMTNSPVFIKLDRVSEGKIIKVYKFRSMVVGAETQKNNLLNLNERKDGPFFKIKNDPRITKVGRFLRKFRLDEFPQLINVLKGELSLVGPRPHEPGELFAYPREYRILLSAKTGLTGLSQVNGASGLLFLKELEYDKYYLENQSLWLDFKILFKTLIIFFTDPTGV